MDFRYSTDLSALLSFVVLLNMISTDYTKKHHFNFPIIIAIRKKYSSSKLHMRSVIVFSSSGGFSWRRHWRW